LAQPEPASFELITAMASRRGVGGIEHRQHPVGHAKDIAGNVQAAKGTRTLKVT
jgi:hypothetical protein